MKFIAPDYYEEFKCIADKCRHNCCIGWEIDIDDDTHEYYRSLGGELGEKLKKNISVSESGACFVLDEAERCPFLCDNGLCELITALGEGALCQICADHPRFRTYLSDRTEIGLGLCCEAAARLILANENKTVLKTLSDDGEAEAYEPFEAECLIQREHIFDLLQNRDVPIEKRVEVLLSEYNAELPEIDGESLFKLYFSLERLDARWDERLCLLENSGRSCQGELSRFDKAFEQLLVYFIYRHFLDAALDGKERECVRFAAASYKVIRSICEENSIKNGVLSLEDIIDTARAYSSETEYSEENMELLFETFRNI